MKIQNTSACWLPGLLVLILLMAGSFCLGRWWMAGATGDVTEESRDTVVVKDTVRVPGEALPAQVIAEEVIRYKYVPVLLTDTLIEHDTLIRVKDSVAVIPVMRKTYTDSATYRAVVSGYDPRLEEIEVYRDNMTITVQKKKARRWGVGVQAGAGVGLFNRQPDIFVGLGVQYNLWP